MAGLVDLVNLEGFRVCPGAIITSGRTGPHIWAGFKWCRTTHAYGLGLEVQLGVVFRSGRLGEVKGLIVDALTPVPFVSHDEWNRSGKRSQEGKKVEL